MIQGCEISNERVFPVEAAHLYRAVTEPQSLDRWWGPNGITTTTTAHSPSIGGQWLCTMALADGTEFHNVYEYRELVPERRVVLEHFEPVHHFLMTMTLTPAGSGTLLAWVMRMDTEEEVARLGAFLETANEENFDRLAAVLAEGI